MNVRCREECVHNVFSGLNRSMYQNTAAFASAKARVAGLLGHTCPRRIEGRFAAHCRHNLAAKRVFYVRI